MESHLQLWEWGNFVFVCLFPIFAETFATGVHPAYKRVKKKTSWLLESPLQFQMTFLHWSKASILATHLIEQKVCHTRLSIGASPPYCYWSTVVKGSFKWLFYIPPVTPNFMRFRNVFFRKNYTQHVHNTVYQFPLFL